MYHLVYAGRGAAMRDEDVTPEESRAAVGTLVEKAMDWAGRGVRVEILTADNHADGVLLLRYVEATAPELAAQTRADLERAGGCSAGRKFAAVDFAGDARPCQFWRHESFANVRNTRFSQAWDSGAGELLRALRDMPSRLRGRRCGGCRYKRLCGGCRVRALAATGDIWGDDPKCYLTDSEIGI
jgi:radical SAM protein with 4Fe4S-binding SPASM domain